MNTNTIDFGFLLKSKSKTVNLVCANKFDGNTLLSVRPLYAQRKSSRLTRKNRSSEVILVEFNAFTNKVFRETLVIAYGHAFAMKVKLSVKWLSLEDFSSLGTLSLLFREDVTFLP